MIEIASTTAFILCSSGTTDEVKGVFKSHKEITLLAMITLELKLGSSDVLFFFPQIYWITGIFSLMQSGFYGVKRVITSKMMNMTGDFFLDMLENHNVGFIIFYDYLLELIKRSKNPRQIKSVHTIMVGSNVIQEEFLEKSKVYFPNAKMVPVYGSTEGGLVSIARNGQKSWSSGQLNGGYKAKVKVLIKSK